MATKGLRYFSQQVQDWAVFTTAFADSDRPGTYVDLAANHFREDSNSYFFDRCLGWRGVCIEPNPKYHGGYKEGRSCDFVPACVTKQDGVYVNFEGAGQTAHATPTNATGNVWPQLRCMSLATILRERRITHVDYLSLDVEGFELDVFQGVDWSVTSFDIMTVERAEGGVRNFLAARGYEAAFCASLDTVFVRSANAALKSRAYQFLNSSMSNSAARHCISPAGARCNAVWATCIEWRKRGRPM